MSAGRGLVGGALVALGALYLLDVAGVIEAGGLVGKWWPALFIALGVVQAFMERRLSAVVVVLVLGGGLLLAVSTGRQAASVWYVLRSCFAGLLLADSERYGTFNPV